MARRYSRIADGDVYPMRFVKLSTSTAERLLQAGAGDMIFGVSQKGTRFFPVDFMDDGKAAVQGEMLHVYGPGGDGGGEILLELGGTVATQGVRLKSDADGKGTPVTADGDQFGAISLRGGVSGDFIPVDLVFPTQRAS